MIRVLIWSVPMLFAAAAAPAQTASPEPIPATAVQTATTPAAQTAAVPAAKPKKICRKTIMTGRRIAQSTCYTAEQWADYDRAQNEAARKMIGDVTSAGGKSNLASSSSAPIFGLGNQ